LVDATAGTRRRLGDAGLPGQRPGGGGAGRTGLGGLVHRRRRQARAAPGRLDRRRRPLWPAAGGDRRRGPARPGGPGCRRGRRLAGLDAGGCRRPVPVAGPLRPRPGSRTLAAEGGRRARPRPRHRRAAPAPARRRSLAGLDRGGGRPALAARRPGGPALTLPSGTETGFALRWAGAGGQPAGAGSGSRGGGGTPNPAFRLRRPWAPGPRQHFRTRKEFSMPRFHRLAGALALSLGLAGAAHAQTFTGFYAFGDSLTDSGNIGDMSSLPPGFSFTTNPDPVMVEIVAGAFGHDA